MVNPVLVAGALLGSVVINTMLREADSDLPIPELDLSAHVQSFLHGYTP